MPATTPPRRKLIEVSLPLEKINAECAREKSIRHGHPSTLHLWWARRPLAAARAVLFSQLVDDPSCDPRALAIEDEAQREVWITHERWRLHELIERLVVWENTGDDALFAEAHAEILRCSDGNPPPILDPFAGGGSIPLEAQRLGLEAYARDLNPVAVLINKALIEIPPKFAGRPPVFPGAAESRLGDWPKATGLAEDVRRYGEWMRDRAKEQIGYLYPDAVLADGTTTPVIAWIWARTVTCPNPACRLQAPLVNSFTMCSRRGKWAQVEPVVGNGEVDYTTSSTEKSSHEGTLTRAGARCITCNTPISFAYIRLEGKARRLGRHQISIVAEGVRRRIYLAPSRSHVEAAHLEPPDDFPHESLPEEALGFRVQNYGLTTHADLTTARQKHLLTTLVGLIGQARIKCIRDGADPDYADAVSCYLTLWLGRVANRSSSQSFWHPGRETVEQVFARNALPMIWVYAEGNPFSTSSGNILGQLDYLVRAMSSAPSIGRGHAEQADASLLDNPGAVFSTDPPYYDNVPYADLSDFFYVWHRRSLSQVLPDLYSTLLTPKAPELIAEPARAGSASAAAEFFEKGLSEVFQRMVSQQDRDYPFTIYYAFKQTQASSEGESSTGWEKMLQSLLDSGAMITATWPMRTELAGGLRELGRNSLASSVVLACRRRPQDVITGRRDFLTALRTELPDALRELQQGSIAPVDLPQAAIGPGMAVYSRYSAVLNDNGSPMSVCAALVQINQTLDEVLTAQENDFDANTRFATQWFRQHGFTAGTFGDADNLARARNADVAGLARSGILTSQGGRVQLIAPGLLPADYDPATDAHPTVWEIALHLTRVLGGGGIPAASALMARVPTSTDLSIVKELAYLLFSIAEDRGQTTDAVALNALVASWNEIAAGSRGYAAPTTQSSLDFTAADDDTLL